MSYQSPIEIIYGNLKLETENAIVRAVQQVGINVDKEELQKALAYDRHMYERGRRDRDSEIIRCWNCFYADDFGCPPPHPTGYLCQKGYGSHMGDWFCADAVHKEKENEK